MADPAASPVARSPDSEVSPFTKPDQKAGKAEYFLPKTDGSDGSDRDETPYPTIKEPSPSPSVRTEDDASTVANDPSSNSSAPSRGTLSAKSSIASVVFRPPRNLALPQGAQRKTDGNRLRNSSPRPERFRHHVSFDNIPVGEATKNNVLGYTINLTHDGYQPKRRSRTMMAGVDQHFYSDYALQWLLEEYAEDGDEVICVHVSERDSRDDKNYKSKAQAMVERIKQKIPPDCAISIKLEYAVGKLHETFQKLIYIYQPSMLVVGTRGRSLGGLQGLVNTRNSFSKYCLQYSPVPTVVVRDIDKRKKKKEKRSQDPNRQSYISMLASNDGKHEADSENSSLYELEARLSPDEEAHRVAAAIGLPSSFDPTIEGVALETRMHPRIHSVPTSPLKETMHAEEVASALAAVPAPPSTLGGSDDDESADDSGDEFEVMSGEQIIAKGRQGNPDEKIKKTKLHQMEVAEAAALREQPVDDDDDDDDDEDNTQGGPGSQDGQGLKGKP
ncbi:uncharacterized protein PgNI_09450 [Pyricularia grisea]|uniref:UspA domain-containing protein n=1 Tax=Pyricularia grisea TaxID=148305 RepID=A0A6P8AS71_PYRGI|nr:uncharacterized protein PgNI_09450 [Pyricularia grisea]TLD04942.1 hypothetical protein PgNI_09450 [Pyricularia grisea]